MSERETQHQIRRAVRRTSLYLQLAGVRPSATRTAITRFYNSNKVIGFEKAGDFLKRSHPELLISKQKLRQAEAIQLVRLKRDNVNQSLGFASRPFVLCGLPMSSLMKNGPL